MFCGTDGLPKGDVKKREEQMTAGKAVIHGGEADRRKQNCFCRLFFTLLF
jgi:hypothetical protein